MIGQTVSHYRILEPLGEGGMGTVYLAEDTHLGRRVAIKFPSINSDTHDYRARFLREARSVSELSHPGIATLFDYGETNEGRPFLVMELAKGRPLTEVLRKGEVSLARAVEIVSDVAAALVEAHARGVVHRDIKPSNIMIDDNGKVKVLDFGLAKQLNKEPIQGSQPEAQTLLSTETQTGIVLGTPAYLSPEQATGGAIDGRSDLFSLGTLLYEATTGRTPFAGKSFIEIAANVLHVEPAPPSRVNPKVPPALDFITLKALAKMPIKRYQSAKELIADLNAVKEQLGDDTGQTLIKQTSSVALSQVKTLRNLSQILKRPRIPISYILIGALVLVVAGGVALRFGRPTVHTPPAEAQRWYEIGTGALREGAYYQASKALEKAVASDDGYILAHARLAEALVELDYVDRAKDELLRVNSTSKTELSDSDALYLEAITATVRRDYSKAISLYQRMASQASDPEKPYVLVDLARAWEKNDDSVKAIEVYTEASSRNPDYPTPLLQLGVLYGRAQQLPKALASFEKAEAIYQALGNLEGRTEVIFQRGSLLNKANRVSEAESQLEQALRLSRAADNKSQEIKILLQLSSVAVDVGESVRATEYARDAVALAQANGMENLSARGLTDLGNALLIRGEYGDAEKYLMQALESAQRAKARRNEARARVSLASLRGRQNNPDEVLRNLEPALAFYQQGGYRSETFSCLALIARTNFDKGDAAAATKGHEQLLQLAKDSNDQSMLALAHAERGTGLALEQKFSEALQHFDQAYAIYKSLGIQRSMGYNMSARSDALWRLGRYSEAQTLLDDAAAIADNPGGGLKRLSIEVKLSLAEIALSQGNFADAKIRAEQIVHVAEREFKDAVTRAKIVIGLAQSYTGATAAGKNEVAEAVEIVKQLNDRSELTNAQLRMAEAMLLAGDWQGASDNALFCAVFLGRVGQLESEWRALLIAAQAKQNLGDKSRAREYAMRAKDLLSKLEERWGSENYNSYLSRSDIQRLRKQLDQVSGV